MQRMKAWKGTLRLRAYNESLLQQIADKEGRWPCLGDRYCHRLAFCNMKIKRCQCNAGLVGNGIDDCHVAPGRFPCNGHGGCPYYSYCNNGHCKCRDELIGNGKTCVRAPRKKCKEKKDCHTFALCMNGYCVCQDSAGNGEYCRKRYNICFPKDPCGLNNCRKDVLLGHLWCICKVGVDKYGNCVECFKDEHCKELKAICVNHKCECKQELYRLYGSCVNDDLKQEKCRRDKHCHPKAKCDEGSCRCGDDFMGNGLYCRKGVACPKVRWLKNACGKRGRCLLDPNVNGFRDCKCLPGHYYQHFYKDLIIAKCIECTDDQECGISAKCVNYYCVCKDELIKKGFTKTCLPAPQQKCKLQSECHEQAKCFMGFCICQSNFTGNGKFCREGKTCSAEQLKKCGNHSTCIADPILPDKPVCRCLKGFRLNNKKSCVDIDECKTFRAKCKESRCVNTIGSFICTKCKPGYIDGPEGACVADDECGGCGENEECHDGECFCKEGYDMDQFKKCYSTEGDNCASSLQLICGLWMFLLNFLLH
ncbi:tenascin-like isoform X2 [Acropora muricata]|uniref:tenascin-like isoform X2 n=1 Tax=Acropora muricata TaxID=159855 RepID=UPI0034E5BD7B